MKDVLRQNDLVVTILGAFAVIGVLIAVIGLYGVIAQLTIQRTREIGIRIAVGAAPAAVERLILTHAGRLVVIGLTFGLLGAHVVDRFYQSLWPQLAYAGPGLHAGIALILLFAALGACWLPARRAAKIDPVVALRAE